MYGIVGTEPVWMGLFVIAIKNAAVFFTSLHNHCIHSSAAAAAVGVDIDVFAHQSTTLSSPKSSHRGFKILLTGSRMQLLIGTTDLGSGSTLFS